MGNAFHSYVVFMSRLHSGVEKSLFKWGRFAGNHPRLCFFGGGAVLLVLCIGLIDLHLVTDIDRAFAPNPSEARNNEDWYTKKQTYGPFPYMDVATITAQDGESNVLNKQVLLLLLDIHKHILDMSVEADGKSYRYNDLCFKPLDSRYTAVDALKLDLERPCYYSALISYYDNATYVEQLASAGRLTEPLKDLSESAIGGFFSGPVLKNNQVQSAGGIATKYYVSAGEDSLSDVVAEWEQMYIDYMRELNEKYPELKISYFTHRTINDEVTAAVLSDVYLYVVGIIVMIAYLATSAGKKSLTKSRVGLAVSAIFLILFAIAAGFGICSAVGIQMVTISMFLLLLLIGVGVDSVYLIVNTLDRTDNKLDIPTRLGKVMAEVGINMTISSASSALAFLTTTFSTIYAISSFCAYGVACLVCVYFAFMTMFLPLVYWDEKRLLKNKCSLCCCVTVAEDAASHTTETAAPTRPSRMNNFFRHKYAPWLLKPITRVCVLVLFAGAIAYSVYGILNLRVVQDSTDVLDRTSYAYEYLTVTVEEFSENGDDFYVVLRQADEKKAVDFSSPKVLNYMRALEATAKKVEGVSEESVHSWLSEYLKFLPDSPFSGSLDSSGYPKDQETFYNSLFAFLGSELGQNYMLDVVFDSRSKAYSIKTCQFNGRHLVYTDAVDNAKAMNNLIDALAEVDAQDTQLESFAINGYYNIMTAILIIPDSVLSNLLIASAVVFVISVLLLVHPIVGLVVLVCIGTMDVLLLGSLYLFGLNMSTVTSVIVVMAVGFGNEYFTNLTHGFMISKGTREERVTESLSDLGGSVLNGGFTTTLAVAMLSFSSSDVFLTFFSVTVTIVLLAELIAFTFMMVLLSCVGPKPLPNMTKGETAAQQQRDTTLTELDVRDRESTTRGDGSVEAGTVADKV